MKIFALISDNVVVNTIKADDDFAVLMQADFEFVVDVTTVKLQPSIGWRYEASNGTFVDPNFIELGANYAN